MILPPSLVISLLDPYTDVSACSMVVLLNYIQYFIKLHTIFHFQYDCFIRIVWQL